MKSKAVTAEMGSRSEMPLAPVSKSLPTGRQRPLEGFLIVGASLALLLGFVILKARAR